jgi:alpha-1,6-mannosyltransferase
VAGEDFAAGALAVLARPVTDRRRAARQRAEEFGWPAAVGRFLAAHGLAVHDLVATHGLKVGGPE